MNLRYWCTVKLAICLIALAGCFSETPEYFQEERLRRRIELAWSYFSDGNLDAYLAMWSTRAQPGFRGSQENWHKVVNEWQRFLTRDRAVRELLDIQITGVRARVKIKTSILKQNGSRAYGVVYDYWVFEGGDWFLEDAGRTS